MGKLILTPNRPAPMPQRAGIPPSVTAALGLQPGATARAHRLAAIELQVGAEVGRARAHRFAAASEWLEQKLGIGAEIAGILTEVAELLDLAAGASQADVVERLKALFEYGDPSEVQHAARTLFRAQVDELRRVEQLSVGDAQERVARQSPQLFAAAYAVSRDAR